MFSKLLQKTLIEARISKTFVLEAPGIDPGTSRMLSERSTIWATPPVLYDKEFQPLYESTHINSNSWLQTQCTVAYHKKTRFIAIV